MGPQSKKQFRQPETNCSPSVHHDDELLNDSAPPLLDGAALARVVGVDADKVWLEPIQTGSCGGCASAETCGSKGIGTLANRLEARRFPVNGQYGLRVGEQVEVVFGEKNLVKAAAIAYAIPLLFALITAAIVQAQLGRDGATMLGAIIGLAIGLAVMKAMSARLEAQGALQARIVRRHEQTVQFFQTGA